MHPDILPHICVTLQQKKHANTLCVHAQIDEADSGHIYTSMLKHTHAHTYTDTPTLKHDARSAMPSVVRISSATRLVAVAVTAVTGTPLSMLCARTQHHRAPTAVPACVCMLLRLRLWAHLDVGLMACKREHTSGAQSGAQSTKGGGVGGHLGSSVQRRYIKHMPRLLYFA